MTDPAATSADTPPLGRHGQPRHPDTVQAQALPATVTEYPVAFTGTADEYFRLWIVNVALTFVTLGLYLPWARVRNRQYFSGTPGWTARTSSTAPIRRRCCAAT